MRRFEHPSLLDQAEALAGSVSHALDLAIQDRGHAVLAVSGGRSPVPMFERLRYRPVRWDAVSITLVDERAVPPGHEDSNARLVQEHLLRDAAAAASFVPLIADALEASEPARAVVRLNGAFAQPDVAVLGMGEDGHTASLFADAPELGEALNGDTPCYVVTRPASAPHARVTLNLTALLATERVFLAFAGAAKAEVFERALQEPGPALPVGLVASRHRHGFDVFTA
ncbi:6-phosphogluconolactonase [Cupriavidus gilardii]|uniref:6-phosphogluconolactonase n=1 Tax=Cupriavidus gilardii TaxID=82541 RepID=UPI001ABE395C|nr:6-phosphogluconolactonase [Cupriavidus gilardii]MBO4123731.1 6-phosphogluconolactonase [Cupriavidus gilardii]